MAAAGTGWFRPQMEASYGDVSCYQIEQLQFYEVNPSAPGMHEFPIMGKHFGFMPTLIQASDGNLWNATYDRQSNQSIVFAISTTTGTLVKRFAFDGANGDFPDASVVQGANGKLYGTATGGGTVSGGQQAAGTVWVLDAGLRAPEPVVAALMPSTLPLGF
jgi:hypothetical protein